MSGTKDLKDLLDRLKGEVGSLPEIEESRAAAGQRAPQPGMGRQERLNMPDRAQGCEAQFSENRQRAQRGGPQNLGWSENKESMFFGMLASLTAALGGILAGLDYLTLIGSLFFSFFSLVMLLALFRVCLNSGRAGGDAPGLADRVTALSRKVEMLSSRAALEGGGSFSAGNPDRERELEQKVEELRALVKTLAKAVEGEK